MPKQYWIILLLAILLEILLGSPAIAGAPATSAYDAPAAWDFHRVITDPNVAYLLLGVAILGLAVEILTPGLIIPGSIGVIAAILAVIALSQLPVNAIGFTILILALPLFVLGAFVASAFIPLSVVGVAALLTGSILLFQSGLRPHPALIAAVVIILSVCITFVADRVVKAQRLNITTGREGMICNIAVVRTPLAPEGTVTVEGEIWQAVIDKGSAQPGDRVVITRIQGLKLLVAKERGVK